MAETKQQIIATKLNFNLGNKYTRTKNNTKNIVMLPIFSGAP
jgi:hypothetical protein